MAEIATPSEVLNITEENNFFFLAFPDQHSLYTKFGVENITEMCSNDSSDCYKFKLKIPTGNYMSPKYLVEEMQASIDKFEKGILKHVNAYVSITYDALSQRLKVSAPNERQVRIIFPNQFAQILGLDPTMNGKPIGNEENMFKFNVNLHNNFRSLYVYSDIASFTFIGDTVAPLLRIVPFSHNSKTGYVYKEFKTLHYVSVSKSADISSGPRTIRNPARKKVGLEVSRKMCPECQNVSRVPKCVQRFAEKNVSTVPPYTTYVSWAWSDLSPWYRIISTLLSLH